LLFDVGRVISRIKQEIRVFQLVLKDSRTPRLARWLPGLAIGYAVSPVDLIPDFIPILGHLDDLIIVPLPFRMAVSLIPNGVVEECRKKIDSD
jgi:uncharacterized membrane protein YkvA (DUF1232 family)